MLWVIPVVLQLVVFASMVQNCVICVLANHDEESPTNENHRLIDQSYYLQDDSSEAKRAA
jgi:hypothetical protein